MTCILTCAFSIQYANVSLLFFGIRRSNLDLPPTHIRDFGFGCLYLYHSYAYKLPEEELRNQCHQLIVIHSK